ncbi:hypothetical protein J1N35_042653 [Gossypium stocksii]|uniref:Uncharacterized protein n=1 Tax=Gossypium stocksii TaxID=47602 RepID=A0A9D3U5V8_9ROSI|nr:hypothetical protein J1N35_042653 [Gossypium stocksii]
MVNRSEPIEGVPSIVTSLSNDEFNKSEREEELNDFDGFDCAISDHVFNNAGMNVCDRVRINLDSLNMDDIQLGELSEKLNSVHESEIYKSLVIEMLFKTVV